MTPEQIMARNNELESNNRILLDKIKREKEEKNILKEKYEKDIQKLYKKIADMENDHGDYKYCTACEHYRAESLMRWIGNDYICEYCLNDGYGK